MTRVYLRDSLLIDMTADDKTRRDAGSIHIDQIGKVFAVVGQDVRQCLICDCVFTRQEASAHANVMCMPDANRYGVAVTTTSVMIDRAI